MRREKLFDCFIVFLLTMSSFFTIHAQEGIDQIVHKEKVTILVDSIANLVEYYYISEETGKEIATYIRKENRQGTYKNLSYKEFGKRLTNDLRTVSGDVHMSVFYRQRKETSQETMLSIRESKSGASSNYGYVEAKISEENIGYLKIAHFTNWNFFEEAKQAASTSIKLLENTDALIIDLRNNGGGFEDIVAHVMSHFFDGESQLLQTYYCRYQDRSNSIHITKELPVEKLPDLPIYILVNKKTGSAAESFAYMMKHLNRATIIGETTIGAGNGANNFRISDELVVQIATWETINAVTKTSWEKVGVVPNIQTTSEEAFEKALELAKISGKEYHAKLMEDYKALVVEMEQILEEHVSGASNKLVVNILIKCHKAGLIKEGDINNMGYEFLGRKKTATAEAVFKANTILYPNSANVYDSYGEALAINGHLKTAIYNYQKAVITATENGNSNLEIFVENLGKTKKLLEKQ